MAYPQNRLERLAQAVDSDPDDFATHRLMRAALLDDFAAFNGVRVVPPFALAALVPGNRWGSKWGQPYRFPGCAHLTCFKREGRPLMALVQPQDTAEVQAYVEERGLVLHMPPIPTAALWPEANFVVVAPPSVEEVTWLPDQLLFGGPVGP